MKSGANTHKSGAFYTKSGANTHKSGAFYTKSGAKKIMSMMVN